MAEIVPIGMAAVRLAEPDWTGFFSDELEVKAAREYWRVALIEMREVGTLSETNAHLLTRLVCVYVAYDRAVRQVAEFGAVVLPKRKSPKAIPRVSPWFTAMTSASREATALESELGLTPASRGSVTKADRKRNRAALPADEFLGRPIGQPAGPLPPRKK